MGILTSVTDLCETAMKPELTSIGVSDSSINVKKLIIAKRSQTMLSKYPGYPSWSDMDTSAQTSAINSIQDTSPAIIGVSDQYALGDTLTENINNAIPLLAAVFTASMGASTIAANIKPLIQVWTDLGLLSYPAPKALLETLKVALLPLEAIKAIIGLINDALMGLLKPIIIPVLGKDKADSIKLIPEPPSIEIPEV